jgi:hypothetical protein
VLTLSYFYYSQPRQVAVNCRLCGRPVFPDIVDGSPVERDTHPCCEFWIGGGRSDYCRGCAESQAAARRRPEPTRRPGPRRRRPRPKTAA